MKRALFKILILCMAICSALCVFTACGATHTITAENTKLTSEIVFKTLSVDEELNVYGKVANTKATFSFINEVEVKGNATFVVSTDIYGMQQIPTKTVPIEIGDNTFYITETVGNDIRLFTVTVRRRPVYTVSFNTDGGSVIEPQYIEEDSFSTEPTTTRAGYTFNGWDYDFRSPITKNTTINASWTANTNTPYKVEYYLENLDNENYTLFETENLTGTTDTTATAEIKTYEHFTHTTISESKESGNINADGNVVLKVYYMRNEYTIRLVAGDNVTVLNATNGKYKYGYTINEITADYNEGYLGYDWKGWHNGDDVLTYDNTIPSFTVDKDMDFTADFSVKPEMSNYDFTSDTETCTITGVKDKTITEIIVPNFVTSIGNYAFSDCRSLEYNEYDNGLYLGNASNKYVVLVKAKSTFITTFEINSNTKFIYNFAFSNCSSLTEITIPDSVTSIGSSAFSSCRSLTNITIGDSVTSIGNSAFQYCSSLTSITIPNSVTSIGNYAFDNCSSLEYNEYDNGLYLGNVSNKYVVLVKAKSTSITTFEINSNTKVIYSSAFSGCSSLTSVTIGNSVTSIVNSAFYNCSSLTSITIPNSITSIENYAFYNCSSLTEITIPDSVTSIGSFAFSGCSSLTSVNYTGTIDEWCAIDFKGAGANPLHCAHYLYINDELVNEANLISDISHFAFSGAKSLTSITIGDSITSIGGGAFRNCSNLTSVTIGKNVTRIGGEAFESCLSLTRIDFNGTQQQWNAISKGSTWHEYVPSSCVVHFADGTEIPINEA